MKKILPIVLCCAAVSCTSEEQVGDIYRGWQDGQMEIHHIYTGRGESSFIIMPDATTMLIDVGDHDPTVEQYALMTEALPDRQRRAGEYVARYVERVNPEGKSVDYLMLSHFHCRGGRVPALRYPIRSWLSRLQLPLPHQRQARGQLSCLCQLPQGKLWYAAGEI